MMWQMIHIRNDYYMFNLDKKLTGVSVDNYNGHLLYYHDSVRLCTKWILLYNLHI